MLQVYFILGDVLSMGISFSHHWRRKHVTTSVCQGSIHSQFTDCLRDKFKYAVKKIPSMFMMDKTYCHTFNWSKYKLLNTYQKSKQTIYKYAFMQPTIILNYLRHRCAVKYIIMLKYKRLSSNNTHLLHQFIFLDSNNIRIYILLQLSSLQ